MSRPNCGAVRTFVCCNSRAIMRSVSRERTQISKLIASRITIDLLGGIFIQYYYPYWNKTTYVEQKNDNMRGRHFQSGINHRSEATNVYIIVLVRRWHFFRQSIGRFLMPEEQLSLDIAETVQKLGSVHEIWFHCVKGNSSSKISRL